MRVQDSLARGSSRFHAEVTRLKQCLDQARQADFTFVLFDEILAGTNSRERHLGTRAVLEMLASLPAATLIATHDLALAELVSSYPDRVRIVHFRDQVQDGQLAFDYELRPGPLTSTNALRVMRAAGLEVPEGKE
jgi:DNA mismatch repair ATPase MutS